MSITTQLLALLERRIPKSVLTTAGDILYRAATLARLPIGTAGQVLTVNAGATAPEWAAAAGGSVDRSINMFRLTLESGVAVSTTDQTAKTTVYACPAAGSATEEAQISLLGTDDTTWATHSTAQMSIGTTTTRNGTTTNGSAVITGLATTTDLVVGQEITGTGVGAGSVIASIDSDTQVTGTVVSTASATVSVTFKCPASKNYDLFVMNIAGTPTLVLGPVWTNDTTWATAITQKDGVAVLSGAFVVGGTSYAEGRLRHVGCVGTTATAGQTEAVRGGLDTAGSWLIWSSENQEPISLQVGDSTTFWTYVGDWRQCNNTATNKCSFILGRAQDVIANHMCAGATSAAVVAYPMIGIGLDAVNASVAVGSLLPNIGAQSGGAMAALYGDSVAMGRHYVAAVERTYATTGNSGTWYGKTAGIAQYHGLHVEIMA